MIIYGTAAGTTQGMMTAAVRVPAGEAMLDGDLNVPADRLGIVLFAHGSGSSRHSPRNRYVASQLNRAGMATLLVDLLTREEEEIDAQTAELRFNIRLLSQRLISAVDFLAGDPRTRTLPIGCFGASTGAAAALVAAAERGDAVAAVVSRGGRPDLAGDALPHVSAPTLLIVGGADEVVIWLNQQAMRRMRSAETRLEIVPGATHLFEEAGALEAVADLAAEFFRRHLPGHRPSGKPAIASPAG